MLDDYTPTSRYYAEAIGKLGSRFNSNAAGESGGSGGGGGETCAGCQSGCTGNCSTSCTGDCITSCSNACSADCKSDCKAECKGSCKGSCKGTCEDACQACQTYCENEENYSKNTGKSFSWSVTPTEGEQIKISSTDWNKLVNYVEEAAPYCTDPKIARMTILKASPGPITAAVFNDLVDGLAFLRGTSMGGLSNKKGLATNPTNPDKIKAADFRALASNYKAAKFRTSAECCQIKETPEKDFGRKQPCEDGQSCTANGQKSP